MYHNPASPLLIVEVGYGDVIHQAKQESWKDGQLSIFDYI